MPNRFGGRPRGSPLRSPVIRALDVRSRARLLRVLGYFPSGDLATTSRAEISDHQVFPTESASPVFVHRVETPGTVAQPARPRETKQISLGAVLLGGEEFVLIVGPGLTTAPEKIEQVARLARARGNALLLAIQEPGSRRFDLERFRQFRNVTAEHGIRTFESVSRTTLDLGAIMALKDRTHLPVVVDPAQCVTQAHPDSPPGSSLS